MPQTMKALVKKDATKGIWMMEVPLPEIGPNDVLIKLEKTAICGTDLHIYKWDEWSQRVIKPGLVIGHEFVGRIVDMGPGVRGYTVGQRVSAGQLLCGIYSQEVYAAEIEYLSLMGRVRPDSLPRGEFGDQERRAREELIAAARKRLALWDVPKSEIERPEPFQRSPLRATSTTGRWKRSTRREATIPFTPSCQPSSQRT